MTDLWVDLLPVLFAMMISPARTLAVIILLHTPKIGGFALAQERVGPILDSVFESIRAHLRPTAIGLFGGFGIIFVVKGLSALG